MIFAFKGAIRDFLQSPHCAANHLQHICSSGLGAIMCKSCPIHLISYHVQHVVLRAMWYEGTAQLLSRQSLNHIYFRLTLLVETINRRRRGGNRSTRRKPLTMGFRKCHILKPENSSLNRDSNLHHSNGGRLGKQMC